MVEPTPLKSPISMLTKTFFAGGGVGAHISMSSGRSTRSETSSSLRRAGSRPRFSSLSSMRSMVSKQVGAPALPLLEDDVVKSLSEALLPEQVEIVLAQCADADIDLDAERGTLVSAVIASTRRFLDQPSLVASGCKALLACARANSAMLDAPETCRFLADALALHARNEAVWDASAAALGLIASRSAERAALVVDLRVPELAAEALVLFDATSPAVKPITTLLSALTRVEALQERIFDMGVASALCTAMDKASSSTLYAACLDALTHLASNANLREPLLEQASETLVRCLGNVHMGANTCARCMLVIVSLSLSPSNRLAMTRHGIPRIILEHCLLAHRNQHTVVQLCCEALTFLSLAPDGRPALLRQGAIPRMLDAFKRFATAPEVCFPALAVLRHVTEGSKEACVAVVALHGVETLAGVATDATRDAKVRSEATAVVATVGEFEPERVLGVVTLMTSEPAVAFKSQALTIELCRAVLAVSKDPRQCKPLFDDGHALAFLLSANAAFPEDASLCEYATHAVFNLCAHCNPTSVWECEPAAALCRALKMRDGDAPLWSVRALKCLSSQEMLQYPIIVSPWLVDSLVAVTARGIRDVNAPLCRDAMGTVCNLAFDPESGSMLLDKGCGELALDCARAFAGNDRVKDEAVMAVRNLGLNPVARTWLVDHGAADVGVTW